MPQEKDLKRLVRRRMSETGERYTTARAAITEGPTAPAALRHARTLVLTLSDVERAEEAYARLAALPVGLRRRVTLEGLGHADWRVRRRCARLLDDLTLTDETMRLLTESLRDPHPKVRAAALHSLVCEGCKPEACTFDARAVAESMLSDPNADVRRQAVGSFWRWDAEDQSLEALRAIAQKDPSARVRDLANGMLEHYARRRAGNDARLSLPGDLQAKMAKHAGKWVAVADGTIIAADRFPGQIRRDIRRGPPGAVICWVPSTPTSR